MNRARYLCDLAAIMHTPPPVVDELVIPDFVNLVLGVDADRAAMEKQAR